MAIKESGEKNGVCAAATGPAIAVAAEEALPADDFVATGLSVTSKIAMADKEAYGAAMGTGDKFELISVLSKISGAVKIIDALRGITHKSFSLFVGRISCMRYLVNRV